MLPRILRYPEYQVICPDWANSIQERKSRIALSAPAATAFKEGVLLPLSFQTGERGISRKTATIETHGRRFMLVDRICMFWELEQEACRSFSGLADNEAWLQHYGFGSGFPVRSNQPDGQLRGPLPQELTALVDTAKGNLESIVEPEVAGADQGYVIWDAKTSIQDCAHGADGDQIIAAKNAVWMRTDGDQFCRGRVASGDG